MFKIFERIGSPSLEDFKMLSKCVPYKKQAFQEFKSFPIVSLRKDFPKFKDIDNLLDLLEKCFKYDFTKRITATEAL